ncbi:hypothetical protein GQ55_2G363800 [Panicum hallii var. hallii]|uniref:Uncharacterized protein n=1 Tax=Panicum hallii var. hallii TaxID=1504633 RepID=A0A2T7EW64_9POAL|nr:hypothetical protein GQ55_2G363800 [Panicum hallii var. hallii]
MPPLSSSSGMRRRPEPLAPRSSAAKKPSAPPPHPRQGVRDKVLEPRSRPPREEVPSPLASQSRGRSGTDAPRPRPHASPRQPVVSRSTPPSRSAVSSARSPSASAHLRPGTAVGVRTRTTTLKTGEVLVFWLRAMIVLSTHGGYEVVYDGNWPPGDPYGTVRVRMVEPSPSPTTPPPSLPPSTAPGSHHRHRGHRAEGDAARAEADHGWDSGKSLRLIRRSLLPEMERQARADFHGY